MAIEGRRTRPCRARALDPAPRVAPREPPIRVRKTIPDAWIELELTEGRNRQVRRMTAAVGHPTLRLIRVRIGRYELGSLPAGAWLELAGAARSAALVEGLIRRASSADVGGPGVPLVASGEDAMADPKLIDLDPLTIGELEQLAKRVGQEIARKRAAGREWLRAARSPDRRDRRAQVPESEQRGPDLVRQGQAAEVGRGRARAGASTLESLSTDDLARSPAARAERRARASAPARRR